VVQPATAKTGRLRMKRTILLLAISAFLVVALSVPAFAAPRNEGAPNCERGQFTAAFHQETLGGFLKHFDKVFDQCGFEFP
jgi:hypothetical protein